MRKSLSERRMERAQNCREGQWKLSFIRTHSEGDHQEFSYEFIWRSRGGADLDAGVRRQIRGG